MERLVQLKGFLLASFFQVQSLYRMRKRWEVYRQRRDPERALESKKTELKFQLYDFVQFMEPLQDSVSSSVKQRKYFKKSINFLTVSDA